MNITPGNGHGHFRLEVVAVPLLKQESKSHELHRFLGKVKSIYFKKTGSLITTTVFF